MRILGVDVGGAHVKTAVAQIDGPKAHLFPRRVYPYEIFKRKDDLVEILQNAVAREKPDGVALTMTGELSDVFKNRWEGARWIIRTALSAIGGKPLKVLNVDGMLVSPATALRAPSTAASANWAATAKFVSGMIQRCVIVDIGSTTTDILPIFGGKPAVRGKTDLERLAHGELLYTGYLRTPARAVLPEITVGRKILNLCPEFFAVVGDAHIYLGQIRARDYTITTPDRGAKTKKGAGKRLARLVLSEPGELGDSHLKSLAVQLVERNALNIARAVNRVMRERKLSGAPVILMGPGRIYKKALMKKIQSPFHDTVNGVPVELLDPAACCAALWEERGRG
ncbi:MAG: hypothetical protein HY751_01290 [Nitrospinae bacterium]|nr:hypothetical protein [Nitrospinota bacterium]